MDQEIFDKLVEILNKKNKKKFIIADSQKDKRFNNIVYKNLKNMYNKDIK